MPHGKRKKAKSKKSAGNHIKSKNIKASPKIVPKIPETRPILYLGLALVSICLILLAVIFYPAIKNEINYFAKKPDLGATVSLSGSVDINQNPRVLVAKDKNFSLVVPKIGANARVIANVDPQNSLEYQTALTRGVAHAKGTVTPDQPGNTFLFAHSSDSFLNANIFNAVFYLLNKMQKDDLFYIAYKEKLYTYKVVEKSIVSPTDVTYYNKAVPGSEYTATLMTCWPPATTLKRLVVVGTLQ